MSDKRVSIVFSKYSTFLPVVYIADYFGNAADNILRANTGLNHTVM